MPQDRIEDRIIAKYQGADGNWVVARGKITEVKFLKEAVAEIKYRRGELNRAYIELRDYRQENSRIHDAKRSLEHDRKQFLKLLDSASTDLSYIQRQVENLKERYKDEF